MPNFNEFDRTTKESRAAQKARTQALISGARGADGLTDAERTLIAKCRAQGLDICGGWLTRPDGSQFWHNKKVVQRTQGGAKL